MRLIKHLGILFGISMLTMSLSDCAGSKGNDGKYTFQEETPFTIGDAYFQEWVAGVQGGGSGIKLHIEIKNIQEGAVLKDIYFRKRKQNLINSGTNPDMFICNFRKEMNRDINMDSDPKKEAQNTPPQKFPFNLEDDSAAISYELKGELYFVKVSNMEEKPLLAYPGGDPVNEY